MSEKFFSSVLNMLKDRQMSISGISRELKKDGYDIHRLIITGYLRALNDTGYLEESEVPPSKIYNYNHRKQQRDIYRTLEDRLKEIDPEFRFPVAVYLLTNLFNRPCFKYELNLIGITPKNNPFVKESRNERIKEFRENISRFEIPDGDKAYESSGNNPDITSLSLGIISNILKDVFDMTGLKSRYHTTRIWEYVEK
jgi:hypothetical protein